MKQLGLLIVATALSFSAFCQDMTVLNCQCAVALPTADGTMPMFGDQSVFTASATQNSTSIVIKQVTGIAAKMDEQYFEICSKGTPENFRNTCWQHMMNAKNICQQEAVAEFAARGVEMDPQVAKSYAWVQEEGCSLSDSRTGGQRD